MEATTLVLNCGFEPVAQVPWERAIQLLWEKKVEIVSSYEDKVVHSVNNEWKVPSIIRWLKMTTRRKKAIKFSRENVFLRDKGHCQYCGGRVTRNEFTYDHVNPRSRGGKTCWENVVVACTPCNQKKGNRLPQQAGMRLLSTPVKPKKLSEALRLHITWSSSMPDAWRAFMRDSLYWNDILDES